MLPRENSGKGSKGNMSKQKQNYLRHVLGHPKARGHVECKGYEMHLLPPRDVQMVFGVPFPNQLYQRRWWARVRKGRRAWSRPASSGAWTALD